MGPSPYLQMGRIDVPAAIEEEFNDWYNWVYIPTYLTVPGVIRARRFVAVDAQPRYLTVYEFERAEIKRGGEPAQARADDPDPHRVSEAVCVRRKSPAARDDTGAPQRTRRAQRARNRRPRLTVHSHQWIVSPRSTRRMSWFWPRNGTASIQSCVRTGATIRNSVGTIGRKISTGR